MQASPRLDPVSRGGHSASIVRERLRRDQTMRHYATTAALADQTEDDFFGSPSPTLVEHDVLSPNEQMRQATQIAHSFRDHYLAEVEYYHDCQVTVVTIKPASARRSGPSQEIWVDAAGNTTVRQCAQPGTRGVGRRPWFWIASAMLMALGGVLVLGVLI
jgi:hypothetical protein